MDCHYLTVDVQIGLIPYNWVLFFFGTLLLCNQFMELWNYGITESFKLMPQKFNKSIYGAVVRFNEFFEFRIGTTLHKHKPANDLETISFPISFSVFLGFCAFLFFCCHLNRINIHGITRSTSVTICSL